MESATQLFSRGKMCFCWASLALHINATDRRDHAGVFAIRCRRDGAVVRAYPAPLVDLGSVPLSSLTKATKIVFTTSLLHAQHKNDIIQEKLEILLIVFLKRALNGMSSTLYGRKTVGSGNLFVAEAQSDKEACEQIASMAEIQKHVCRTAFYFSLKEFFSKK